MANQSGRGFAGMDDEKQREIARQGGQSVPDDKRSFSKDHELAAQAGRKGGESSHGGQQSGKDDDRDQQGSAKTERGGSGNFANDRDKASEAGRKGGQR